MKRIAAWKLLYWIRYLTKVSIKLLPARNSIFFIIPDIRKVKIEELNREDEVKNDIMLAKRINLDEEIEKEEELEKKIVSVTPMKFCASLKIEDMNKSFTKCLSLLKSFYESLESSKETSSSSKLWNDIKEALNNTPNIFMFQTILKHLGDNCEAVKQFESSVIDSKTELEQQLLPNLNKRVITSGIELLSIKSKLRVLKTQCSESISSVTSSLEGVNNSYNFSFQYEDEDLVGDFIAMLLNRLVMQGKIKYVNTVVAELKQRAIDQDIVMKDFALMTQDLRSIYTSIGEKVTTVQQEIAQMHHINNKLNFGKISMMHLVQDMKNSRKYQEMNRTMLNLSMSVSSTKEIVVPQHRAELQAFLELPMKFLDFDSDSVAFELKKNHLLLLAADEDSMAVLARQADCDFSTLNKFIESVKKNFKVGDLLQSVLTMVEPKVEIPEDISIADLQKRLETNREAITELLDNITSTNDCAKTLLKQAGDLYQYLLTNPLRKFIPESIKVNGKSFKEYENVFNLYYKMIKD